MRGYVPVSIRQPMSANESDAIDSLPLDSNSLSAVSGDDIAAIPSPSQELMKKTYDEYYQRAKSVADSIYENTEFRQSIIEDLMTNEAVPQLNPIKVTRLNYDDIYTKLEPNAKNIIKYQLDTEIKNNEKIKELSTDYRNSWDSLQELRQKRDSALDEEVSGKYINTIIKDIEKVSYTIDDKRQRVRNETTRFTNERMPILTESFINENRQIENNRNKYIALVAQTKGIRRALPRDEGNQTSDKYILQEQMINPTLPEVQNAKKLESAWRKMQRTAYSGFAESTAEKQINRRKMLIAQSEYEVAAAEAGLTITRMALQSTYS
jgi:tRNA U55 pseudouridine synthase TruB